MSHPKALDTCSFGKDNKRTDCLPTQQWICGYSISYLPIEYEISHEPANDFCLLFLFLQFMGESFLLPLIYRLAHRLFFGFLVFLSPV